MSISVNLHSQSFSWQKHELEVEAKINFNSTLGKEYITLKLQAKAADDKGYMRNDGEVTLFADVDQIADLRFQLDKVLEEYSTRKQERVVEAPETSFF